MALQQSGQVFTWGYSGKGLLGRQKKFSEIPQQVWLAPDQEITLSIGFEHWIQKYIEKNAVKVSNQGKMVEMPDGDLLDENTHSHIVMMSCGAVNTLALSDWGDVYVAGDNSYGQHASEEVKIQAPTLNTVNVQEEQTYNLANISVIDFPFKSKDQITYIACGGSHMFAKSSLDQIYGWGRNDEGQIGVGFLQEKLLVPTVVNGISFKGVIQISCGDDYSGACTMYGQVFVAGSLEGGKLGLGKGQRKGFQLDFREVPNLPEIEYISCGQSHMLAISRYDPDAALKEANPLQKGPVKGTGKTYAWGKNLRGQLGIGNKDNQYAPCVIENAKERFSKVQCGINFSLGLSPTNRVYFWGNYKYFTDLKRTRDVEEPLIITNLETSDVMDISVSYKYCIALLDKGELRQWGKFLFTKHDITEEQLAKKKQEKINKKKAIKRGEKFEIKIETISKIGGQQFHVPMSVVIAGPNHATGIAVKRVPYVWGHNNISNRMSLLDSRAAGNAKIDPQPMKALVEKQEVRKNDLLIQRAHMNTSSFGTSRHSSEEESEEGSFFNEEEKADLAEGHPDIVNKSANNKSKSKAGSVRVSGMEPQDEENDAEEGGAGGAGGKSIAGRSMAAGASMNKSKRSIAKGAAAGGRPGDQSVAVIPQSGPGAMNFTQIILKEIEDFNLKFGRPQKHSKQSHLPIAHLFEKCVDLHALEFVRQNLHKRTFPQIQKVWKQKLGKKKNCLDLLNANFQMQKLLKNEEIDKTDEKSIGVFDSKIKALAREVLQTVYRFSQNQIENQKWINKGKSSFFTRIIETPFMLEESEGLSMTFKGYNPELLKYKPIIQDLLLHLHLHPCYIVKILKSKLITFSDQKLMIKQLFRCSKRTGTVRCNYLMISIFEEVLKHDLEEKTLEELQLYAKDNEYISVYIFRRIFKSSQVNMDTLSCIFCHIVNLLMSTFNQPQGSGGPDMSLDVTEEASKGGGGGGAGAKGGKAKGGEKVVTLSPSEKCANISMFMQKFIDSILNDQVLKDTSLNLQYTKKVNSQLDYIKKQVKKFQDTVEKHSKASAVTLAEKNAPQPTFGGLDDNDIRKNYPSFRFTGELMTCVRIINDQLNAIDCHDHTNKDSYLASQILSLVFTPQLEKIMANYELYVFQYLSKVKLLTTIDELIKSVHAINIKNVLHCLQVFFTGGTAFPAKDGTPRTDAWAIDLNMKLNYYYSTVKVPLFHKLMKCGKEIDQIISYKNYENMIIHSLEQDNFHVRISKKLIVNLMKIIIKNQDSISLQFPAKNDPIIKLISQIDLDSLGPIESLDETDQLIMKLKTRLFVAKQDLAETNEDEVLGQFVRCNDCNAILTEDIAVQNFDTNLVIGEYQSDDKQALVQRYQNLMKKAPQMNKDQVITRRKVYKRKLKKGGDDKKGSQLPKEAFYGLDYFVKVSAHIAKNEKDYELSEAIQKFEKNIDIEVGNEETRLEKAQEKADDKAESDGEVDGMDKANPQDDAEQDKENQVYDKLNAQLIQISEKKMNSRIKQKYELELIEFQILNYLNRNITLAMDSFKNHKIPQNIKASQNYDYGLANRDFIHMTEMVQYANALGQMASIKKFIKDLKTSVNLANALKFQQKEAMKGYLQVDVPSLLSNKTILTIKLKELEDLMPHCHVVLIAQDAQSQVVEFKLIFKEMKKQICGPPITVQEQVLMKFNIKPKMLLVQKSITSKKMALGIITEEHIKEVQPLIFEENEAIEFDPDKLMALITQMNRQKAAYVLTAEPEKKVDRSKNYKQPAE